MIIRYPNIFKSLNLGNNKEIFYHNYVKYDTIVTYNKSGFKTALLVNVYIIF